MKEKNLKARINAAVNQSEDPVLLDMILQIFQNSSSVSHGKTTKKKSKKNTKAIYRDGSVPYSDVLRQGQGCLPPGK